MRESLVSQLWNVIVNLMISIVKNVLKLIHIEWNQEQLDRVIQFVEFCLVGVSSAVVMYTAYAISWYITGNYYIANISGFIFSTTNSFIWNSRLVFRVKEKKKLNQILLYLKTLAIYALTGLLLANLLLCFWVEKCGISEMLAPVINIFILTPANYILNKFWAFQKRVEGEK